MGERARAWFSTADALIVLFLAGWLIRTVLAPGTGMFDDLNTFRGWVTRLVERGPSGFYPQDPGDQFFVDYPPGYLYVLWAIGRLARVVWGGVLPLGMMKIPAILGDTALAWLVGTAAQRLRDPHGMTAELARFVGCAVVLLNPAFFFLSAVWGQVDSVLGALVVGGLLLIGTGDRSWRRGALGVAIFALAVGTKPQALFVLPAILVVLTRRCLAPPAPGAPLGQWRAAVAKGFPRLAGFGLVAFAVGVALFAPFRVGPAGIYDFYAYLGGRYPYTGVFAFNLWGAVHFWRPDGYWKPDSGPDAVRLLGVPALYVAAAAFAVVALYICYQMWRALQRSDREAHTLFLGAMALSLSSYALLTRIHERYLFLAIAIGAVFVTQRLARRLFMAGSIALTLTLYFAYVFSREAGSLSGPRLPGYDLVFGETPGGVRMRVYSFVVGLGCLAVATGVWRGWSKREVSPPENQFDVPLSAPRREPLSERPS